jgi:hypothetical protein
LKQKPIQTPGQFLGSYQGEGRALQYLERAQIILQHARYVSYLRKAHICRSMAYMLQHSVASYSAGHEQQLTLLSPLPKFDFVVTGSHPLPKFDFVVTGCAD